jgi:hypothetical protein
LNPPKVIIAGPEVIHLAHLKFVQETALNIPVILAKTLPLFFPDVKLKISQLSAKIPK